MEETTLIFDWKEAEYNIVWDLYCEAELKKFRISKPSDDEVDERSLSWYSWLFRKLSIVNQRTSVVVGSGNEPFFLLRKYFIWLQRSYLKIEDNKIVDPVAFQKFFVSKIRNIAIFVLTLNSIMLTCMLVAVQDYILRSPHVTTSYPLFTSLRGFLATWYVCNVLCLFHFLVLMKTSKSKLLYWRLNIDEVWKYIGIFILMIWLFKICQDTTAYVTSAKSNRCYGVREITVKEESVFLYIFACIVEDAVQSIVFSCMPFPWPWGAVFSILMFYQTVMRTTTCSEYIGVPASVQQRVIEGFNVFIFIFYLINVSLISYSFQRSVLSSYSNTASQSALARNTRAMVELLCTNVKVNVRQVLKTLDAISHFTPPTLTSLTPMAKDMQESGAVVNVAIDHLIFLAKLGEGRFQFSTSDRINLGAALVEVCKDYKRKVKVDRRDVDLQVEIPEEVVSTDMRCFHVLVYYGLMAVDTFVQAVKIKYKESASSETTNQYFIKGHLEESSQPSHEGLMTFRLIIDFKTVEPQLSISDSKQIVTDNNLINSCCIVCHNLVKSYVGDFSFTPYRLECTLPVIPVRAATSTTINHQNQQMHRSNNLNIFQTPREASLDRSSSQALHGNLSTPGKVAIESAQQSEASPSIASPTQVPLEQLLRDYASVYLTVPNVESLVIDCLHSLLRTQERINITTHRIMNPIDLKIRDMIFVQTVEARHELVEAGFNGDIVLFSEKVSYLDARQRALFSTVVPLPPNNEELRMLYRFLSRRLNLVHQNRKRADQYLNGQQNQQEEASSPSISAGIFPRSSQSFVRSTLQGLSSSFSFDSHPQNLSSSSQPDITDTKLSRNWLFNLWPFTPRSSKTNSTNKSIQLSVPPPATWFEYFMNFSALSLPGHQLDNFAKWRFMNPGGDMFHHTTNVEFFSIFVGLLFGYQWIKGLGSDRVAGVCIAFALLLVYRKSVFFVLEKLELSFVTYWVFFSLLNGGLATAVAFSTMGRILNEHIQYSSVEDLFIDTIFIETMIRNGIQIIFSLISLPLILKYFGDYLAWPISLITILAQLSRGFFYIIYMFAPFLVGFPLRFVMFLLGHLFILLLIHLVYSEGLFRDEFLQLHDVIIARSYLEKCLVLARQLEQPLSNVVQAQDTLLSVIVQEAVKGNVLVHELFLSAIKDVQLSSILIQELIVNIRMTQEQKWVLNQDQEQRSVLIRQMRTVILPMLVQSIISRFLDECKELNVHFYVRFAPELTQIRIEEALLLTTLTHICRRTLSHMQEHIYLAGKWGRKSSYWKKQLSIHHQIVLWIYPVSDLAVDTGKPYRYTDVRDLEILLLTTADMNATEHGPRHAQDTKCFAQGIPCSLDDNITLMPLSSTANSFTGNHHSQRPMADLYAEFFGFVTKSNLRLPFTHPGRRRINFEEGLVLHHPQFRSYHRVLVPYLSTPHSTQFTENLQTLPMRFIASAMIKVDSTCSRHYPVYVRFATPHFQMAAARGDKPSHEAATSASTPGMPSSANGASSRDNYYQSSSFGINFSSSSVPRPLVSHFFAFPQSSFASSSMPSSSPFSPSLDVQSSSLQGVNLTGIAMSNLAPVPHHLLSLVRKKDEQVPSVIPSSKISFRHPGMHVAMMLSFPDSWIRQQAVHNQVVFGSVGWLGRLEDLKPPILPISTFAEAECIFIEYLAGKLTTDATNSSSSSSSSSISNYSSITNGFFNYRIQQNYKHAEDHFPGESLAEKQAAAQEYIRLVIQSLRFYGYTGIIVLVGPEIMATQMENDTVQHKTISSVSENSSNRGPKREDGITSNSSSLPVSSFPSEMRPLPSWMYNTAMKADRFLTTPLTEQKLRTLIPDCERRVVELALGVWEPHK